MNCGDDMDLFGGTDAAGGLRADVRLDVAETRGTCDTVDVIRSE